MHYPVVKTQQLDTLNKVGFSAVAAACLMEVLKRQRDAVGLSIYSDNYEYCLLKRAVTGTEKWSFTS